MQYPIEACLTREAAEKAALRWAEVCPEEDITIELEGPYYVVYLPCDEDGNLKEGIEA